MYSESYSRAHLVISILCAMLPDTLQPVRYQKVANMQYLRWSNKQRVLPLHMPSCLCTDLSGKIAAG